MFNTWVLTSFQDEFKPNISVYAHPRDPSNHSSIDSETYNLDRLILQNKFLNNPSRKLNSSNKVRIVTVSARIYVPSGFKLHY